MKMKDKVYLEDIEKNVYSNEIDWKELKGKTIFITGGTGLIGKLLVNTIVYASNIFNLNCKIIALVRNKEKAIEIFKELIEEGSKLELIEEDICNPIPDVHENIDYVVHAASQTSSKLFIEEPIKTINIAIDGTRNVLEFAKNKGVIKFIYLSTMEVYGRPDTDKKIDEFCGNNLLTNEVRNCYPISKNMCENLCICYSKMYGFSTNILRLTQTFGAGVNYYDGRVFAEFARNAIEKKDIILHTKGETKRCYLYTSDAVSAILITMLYGKKNEIYNVANENTYCSISDMANVVAKANNIKVKYDIEENIEKYGYAPRLCMNLDCRKIKQLGWKETINLEDMYSRLIKSMIANKWGGK